jgi:hypothetical protein
MVSGGKKSHAQLITVRVAAYDPVGIEVQKIKLFCFPRSIWFLLVVVVAGTPKKARAT